VLQISGAPLFCGRPRIWEKFQAADDGELWSLPLE
jgi:hypothetical protein